MVLGKCPNLYPRVRRRAWSHVGRLSDWAELELSGVHNPELQLTLRDKLTTQTHTAALKGRDCAYERFNSVRHIDYGARAFHMTSKELARAVHGRWSLIKGLKH